MYRTDKGTSGTPPRMPGRAPAADGDLESSSDWLDELLASDEVSSCVIDVLCDTAPTDFRFLATSPAFERTTGLRDVVGRTMRELRPDYEDFWFDLYEHVARTGKPACFEHTASALERRFRGHAFRLGGAHSRQVMVIFATTLDTGEEGLERFGATLAHELRSPLASMSNGLRVLGRAMPARDSTSQWAMSMMERQIARLSGLIEDMLDIGRLGSTDVHLQREDVDLHQVISESIEACGAAIDAKQHRVSVDAGAGALRVRADVRRLVQVFTNLLSNAIKYTPAGGHIQFRLYRDGGMAVAEVCDDGMGIPPEDLAHVFDLYNQVNTHKAKAEGGLGIGLSIVRSIVRLHGGSVEAHSDGRQKGSTFTVRLPLVS